jgi:hypothetical protein
VLNGNVGVAKSILAEITDESNIARGFSMLPLAAGVGQIIGSGILHNIFILSLISVLQSFYRRRFITASGSLAGHVLAQFLVRVSILPSMRGRGCLRFFRVHHHCLIPERGWPAVTPMEHEINLLLRQSNESQHLCPSLRLPMCNNHREEVEYKIHRQMALDNHCHCAHCLQDQF